jgi:hypothetical protein
MGAAGGVMLLMRILLLAGVDTVAVEVLFKGCY